MIGMPIPIDLREKIEEATRLIETGKESYGSIAKRFGVSKSTVFCWHIQRLSKEVEERRKAKELLEKRIGDLKAGHGLLEAEYANKREGLEEAYRKRREELENEISRLRQEAKAIKASLEGQGIPWEEGVRLLKEVSSLRRERETLRAEIARLRAEVSDLEAKERQSRSVVERLKKERRVLEGYVSCLRQSYRWYLNWLQTNGPRIQRFKASLQDAVQKLAEQYAELEREVSSAKEAKDKLQLIIAEENRIREENKRKIDEYIEQARKLAERIISDAKAERERLLKENEPVENGKRKAEGRKGVLRSGCEGGS